MERPFSIKDAQISLNLKDKIFKPLRNEKTQDDILSQKSFESKFEFQWRKLLAYMGPGFFISIAYIDPGNLGIDIQVGARYSFSLIWSL